MPLHGFDLIHGDRLLGAFAGAQAAADARLVHRDALSTEFDGFHWADVNALAARDAIIGAVSPPADGSEYFLDSWNRHHVLHMTQCEAAAGAAQADFQKPVMVLGGDAEKERLELGPAANSDEAQLSGAFQVGQSLLDCGVAADAGADHLAGGFTEHDARQIRRIILAAPLGVAAHAFVYDHAIARLLDSLTHHGDRHHGIFSLALVIQIPVERNDIPLCCAAFNHH